MIFVDFNHLQEKNLTYFEHMKGALYNSSILIAGGVVGIIHAFIPFIFVTVQTDTVKYLEKELGVTK